MKNVISKVAILCICAMIFGAFQLVGTKALALPSIYDSTCNGCHSSASARTCIGCHSVSNFNGQTNKVSYETGEAMSITISGTAETATSWARFTVFDQNGNQVAQTSGNNSGYGGSSTLPTNLSATAPATPGTYTYAVAWFSNDSSSFGNHREMQRVNTNQFTVVAPAPVDSDGDGVVDNNDQCPNTPANTEVDANGCPIPVDSDSDGVVDNNDQCPNTPANTEVDANGCPVVDPGPTCTDNDNDGFFAEADCGTAQDCDDEVAAVNPGASEFCSDNIDNNCDGLVDGADETTCPAPPTCTDADGDTYFAQEGCGKPKDCNDNDQLTHSGAEELCGDQIDNDCDGSIDENCDLADDDGEILYQQLCASCHGEIPNSDVCGEDAEEIMEAILEDEGGMSVFSQLTEAQIKLISEALSSCSNSDDDTTDTDRPRGKSKEHGKKGKKWDTRSHYDD